MTHHSPDKVEVICDEHSPHIELDLLRDLGIVGVHVCRGTLWEKRERERERERAHCKCSTLAWMLHIHKYRAQSINIFSYPCTHKLFHSYNPPLCVMLTHRRHKENSLEGHFSLSGEAGLGERVCWILWEETVERGILIITNILRAVFWDEEQVLVMWLITWYSIAVMWLSHDVDLLSQPNWFSIVDQYPIPVVFST